MAKANGVLPKEHTGHSKHPLPTTQEKTLHMDITRWSTPKSDWLYSLEPNMEKLYIVSKNKTGSWLWLRSWTLIVKFRLKLKKVRKTTRSFRYDLNQIAYDYEATAAAAATKSLQSCLTLFDPIDGSPPGPAIPGILQARTLEWVAISSSNAWKWKVKVKSLSCVWLLATPWTAAYQPPPSVGFSKQEYWNGLPLPFQWSH